MQIETTDQNNPQPATSKLLHYQPGDFFLEWAATLSTVFLSGAAISLAMRWCSGGCVWDAGGTVFSTILAWICYRFTLSEKCLMNVAHRLYLVIGLPLFWALFFPIILWGLGFK